MLVLLNRFIRYGGRRFACWKYPSSTKAFKINKLNSLTGHTAVASTPPAIQPAASGSILFLYFFPPPSSDILFLSLVNDVKENIIWFTLSDQT